MSARVCHECDRDLTRAFHEPTCSAPAREREALRQAEREAMSETEWWFDDLTPGRTIELAGRTVFIERLHIEDRVSPASRVTLSVRWPVEDRADQL